MEDKCRISDDFGLRSPFLQKPFQDISATSVVARVPSLVRVASNISYSFAAGRLITNKSLCVYRSGTLCRRSLSSDSKTRANISHELIHEKHQS